MAVSAILAILRFAILTAVPARCAWFKSFWQLFMAYTFASRIMGDYEADDFWLDPMCGLTIVVVTIYLYTMIVTK